MNRLEYSTAIIFNHFSVTIAEYHRVSVCTMANFEEVQPCSKKSFGRFGFRVPHSSMFPPLGRRPAFQPFLTRPSMSPSHQKSPASEILKLIADTSRTAIANIRRTCYIYIMYLIYIRTYVNTHGVVDNILYSSISCCPRIPHARYQIHPNTRSLDCQRFLDLSMLGRPHGVLPPDSEASSRGVSSGFTTGSGSSSCRICNKLGTLQCELENFKPLPLAIFYGHV